LDSLFDKNNEALKYYEKSEHNKLLKNENFITKLQASVSSEFIQCKYYLKVRTEFNATMCSSTPFVEIPIVIYTPNDIWIRAKDIQQEQWDPVEMPPFVLDVPKIEEKMVKKESSSDKLIIGI
jgi:hypothetical protein